MLTEGRAVCRLLTERRAACRLLTEGRAAWRLLPETALRLSGTSGARYSLSCFRRRSKLLRFFTYRSESRGQTRHTRGLWFRPRRALRRTMLTASTLTAGILTASTLTAEPARTLLPELPGGHLPALAGPPRLRSRRTELPAGVVRVLILRTGRPVLAGLLSMVRLTVLPLPATHRSPLTVLTIGLAATSRPRMTQNSMGANPKGVQALQTPVPAAGPAGL